MFRTCPLLLKEKRALEVSCSPKFEMLPTSLLTSNYMAHKYLYWFCNNVDMLMVFQRKISHGERFSRSVKKSLRALLKV